MCKTATFQNMPISIIFNILDKLHPTDLLITRNVCKGLRRAVGELGLLFDSVSLTLTNNCIYLNLDGVAFNDIIYTDTEDGNSYVIYKDQEKVIEREHFIDTALADLGIVLNKAIGFNINVEILEMRTYDHFVNALKSKKLDSFCVSKIHFVNLSLEDIIPILPLFKAQDLNEIGLEEAGPVDHFEKIAQLDQWKNSDHFYLMDNAFDVEKIELLFHFKSFDIEVDHFSLENAIQIKDNLLERSNFQECTINLYDSNPIELARVFRQDYYGGNEYEIEYSLFKINCKMQSFDDFQLRITRR